MTHTDLARLMLRDLETHDKNQKFWKSHDSGFEPHKRRKTDDKVRLQRS